MCAESRRLFSDAHTNPHVGHMRARVGCPYSSNSHTPHTTLRVWVCVGAKRAGSAGKENKTSPLIYSMTENRSDTTAGRISHPFMYVQVFKAGDPTTWDFANRNFIVWQQTSRQSPV